MTANSSDREFTELLQAARAGCRNSQGILIERSRGYLLSIAQEELPASLRQKVSDSDLLQTVAIDALKGLTAFQGSTERELRQWLRRILLRNLIDAARSFQTGKRSIHREVELVNDFPESSVRSVPPLTPSEEVRNVEEALIIEQAIARLPSDYQRVLHLRNRDGLPFAEIGVAMDRSADAVRKLWHRALARLEAELNAREGKPRKRE